MSYGTTHAELERLWKRMFRGAIECNKHGEGPPIWMLLALHEIVQAAREQGREEGRTEILRRVISAAIMPIPDYRSAQRLGAKAGFPVVNGDAPKD